MSDKYKHIVLITNTNMDSTAGNVTLLLRRAESMFRVKSYITDVIVYHDIPNKKIVSKNNYYTIRYAKKMLDVKRIVKQINPEHIVLYGDKIELITYPLHHYLKKIGSNADIILDVQSSVEEKIEYAKTFRHKLRYPLYYWAFRLAISNVDGAFVVSNELIDNCEKKKLRKHNLNYYKVRCGINDLIDSEQIKENRLIIRKKYGIPLDAVVFSYSGYRMAWQKVDDIIDDFIKYDSLIDNAYFMFFCNTDEAFETQLKKAFPKGNYCVTLLNKEEYARTLCACDIGYILRDYNETNRVAFPNKFSDYLSTGMLVAMNRALPEPIRLLTQYGIPYIDTEANIEENIERIKLYKANWESYLKEAEKMCAKELLYDSQIEKTDL